MTDTAYLYQYFLKNSPEKKDESSKDDKKSEPKANIKEAKCDGKHSK